MNLKQEVLHLSPSLHQEAKALKYLIAKGYRIVGFTTIPNRRLSFGEGEVELIVAVEGPEDLIAKLYMSAAPTPSPQELEMLGLP